jgi:putative membrane protein
MSSGAVRTSLAERRNVMAAERTLMAWIRTSLTMISFGFTLGKLGNALSSAQFTLMFGRTTDIRGVASYLVVIGTLALILAAIRYRADVAGIPSERRGHLPSAAFIVAILLSLLGLFVFTDLVTRL